MAAPQYDFDLVCIGSGPAGQRGAVQATKLGRRVAVIERKRTVGGVCVDTGTIPSKTLREAVIAIATAQCGPRDGLGTIVPARPSAELLLERVSHVVQREEQVIEQQLCRNDVVLIRGNASFKDPHTLAVESPDGRREVSAANVLIACGTHPAPPTGVQADGDVVVTSDQICGFRRVPRTLAVVGAGVIGIEYASMFAAIGVEVTVIDRRPRPLEFLDHEIVDELIHQMRSADVAFRLEEAVSHIEASPGSPRRAVIHLESGKRIVSDMALFSVGRIGATDTLNLEAAGLRADDRGRLKVGEGFQTEVPHIFAAGDVIGYPSLAATSSEQGRLAACHAFGFDARPMPAHFPVGIYAIPEISMVGSPEHALTEQRVPYEVGLARYREIARGQILGDDSGMFKMLFHRETRQLLGVHAIGTGATELIHIGQAIIGMGGGLDYFLQTVFNYPTLAECYKVAALDAANKLAQ
jgi:NAD(P) transhydrogenase